MSANRLHRYANILLSLLLISFLYVTPTYANAASQPFAMQAFAMPAQPKLSSFDASGQLQLLKEPQAKVKLTKDTNNISKVRRFKLFQLPRFEADFLQQGFDFLPLNGELQISDHPFWNLLLSKGKIWFLSATQSQVVIPISLQEKAANCTHNGVLSFIISDRGQVSKMAFQFAGQTCAYLQFQLWGMADIAYQLKPSAGLALAELKTFTNQHQLEQQSHLPLLPYSQLQLDYPALSQQPFDPSQLMPAEALSVYGVIIDGKHYRGGCDTPLGSMPLCDSLLLPSFSLAKSMMAGVALMALEKRYPGARQALIQDYVPACKSADWQGVTFEHALDMATGHYQSATFDKDEASSKMLRQFFLKTSHKDRIEFACKGFKARSAAGELFVYHTSDTYLLGAAMQAFLQQKQGAAVDLYRDLVAPIWQQLNLSQAVNSSVRTLDAASQPFSGYGMMFSSADLAKMLYALADPESGVVKQLDPAMYQESMQQQPSQRGLATYDQNTFYQNGFWALNLTARGLSCQQAVWLPFMSGYGGLTAVFLPNQTIYYHISDGYVQKWAEAALWLNKIRPLCGDTAG